MGDSFVLRFLRDRIRLPELLKMHQGEDSTCLVARQSKRVIGISEMRDKNVEASLEIGAK